MRLTGFSSTNEPDQQEIGVAVELAEGNLPKAYIFWPKCREDLTRVLEQTWTVRGRANAYVSTELKNGSLPEIVQQVNELFDATPLWTELTRHRLDFSAGGKLLRVEQRLECPGQLVIRDDFEPFGMNEPADEYLRRLNGWFSASLEGNTIVVTLAEPTCDLAKVIELASRAMELFESD